MIAPTLLVGLGGTGGKIISRVAKLANDEQREKLGFAVFDTDINELRDIKEADPFMKTIQTSTKSSVGEYLSIDTHARDTWFPVNAILNSKMLTDGAGQVRAVSRLALDTAIRAGKMEPLHEAIQDLYKLEEGKDEQALRVIIVSSLAGGTGSGLLLPIALYIKNFLATRFRQSANITRGFFILPEVFYEVIKGQSERNNLCCNAYAALRELDSFLMKGDATLPDKYKSSVKCEFPRIGSTGYDEYDVRPYDFCFLFDAQSSEGNKLNSFNEYLDHAANCIYAQSIGPMNKRSNSSEDNTIRKLCAERGRNRYAGAGSSLLIYPFEDVKEYIALKWANECVSKQWLVFDNIYKDLLRINSDQRRHTGTVKSDIDPAKNYRDTVESKANQKDPFAKSIVNTCMTYEEDGITQRSEKWTDYVLNLIAKIKIDESSGQRELDTQKNSASKRVSGLIEEGGSDSWESFLDAYREIEKYKAMVIKRREDTAHTIAYTMFLSQDESATAGRLEHKLETYLRSEKGDFLHPNAVRYFLYKTLELLNNQKRIVDNSNRDDLSYFENFERTSFVDNSKNNDDAGGEGIESLTDRKVSLINRITGKLTPAQLALKSKFSGYIAKINEYRVNSVLELVLEEGIKYVTRLCESFQSFFLSFDGKIASIDKRIFRIEKRYKNSKGKAARYVCASENCLSRMLFEMPYTGGVVEIDGKLAENIYNSIHKYAMLQSKPSSNSFFNEIFEIGILGYFKDKLMEIYGDSVDMNIMDALEAEAKYDGEKVEDKDIQKYVEDAIKSTRALSCPFIERPLGEEADPINACAYNPDIYPDDESPRTLLINKELNNFGGVADADIAKNMIMFYQSYYGLRANNLSKFAPPESSVTSKRDAGKYFNAYYDLVKTIHPQPHLSRAITPHIDRWWHIPTKMPDLDDENQTAQEDRVYAAFFWALIRGHFDLSETATARKIYRLKVARIDMDDSSDVLVVSNGTPCDHLYEVLDAFAIYPELVTKVLERIEYMTCKDVNNSNTDAIEKGELYASLKELKVKEFPLGKEDKCRSIFEIPLLMKKSITPDLYDENSVLRIIDVSIDEIIKYVKRICSEKEISKVVGKVLKEQFEKYIANLAIENKDLEYDYYDYLYMKTCETVGKAFEDLGLYQEAAMARKEADSH